MLQTSKPPEVDPFHLPGVYSILYEPPLVISFRQQYLTALGSGLYRTSYSDSSASVPPFVFPALDYIASGSHRFLRLARR